MIELKDVSTRRRGRGIALDGYSLLLRDGEVRCLERRQGELVINVILGFCPITKGFVCFDGMPLNEYSVAFMRKMIAYIPTPDGFQDVSDPAQKQHAMLREALQSGAAIILAVDPFSHLAESDRRAMLAALRQKAEQGVIVVIATDRADLLET